MSPSLLVAQVAPDDAVALPAGAVAPVEPGATPLAGDPGSGQDKRIFGVLPNYRTADGTMPFRPITTKQKFTIARKDTLDYPSYALAAAFSGLSQVDNSNASFGQGIKGYARRYGSAIADQDLGNFMTEAIFPSLFHEDPRYFRKVHGSFRARLGYAVTRILITRTDAGKWRFNTSEFLGNGTVAAIGNWYYPDARSAGGTLQRMGTQIGTDAISGVLKEFWPDIKQKWLSHKSESAD
ncbi:MAG TPA: hypothetical protein VHZ74_05995 [Bryobacteraceae bacterium]|nr:hypothetical protein [Bryobacteraceae bacterium]